MISDTDQTRLHIDPSRLAEALALVEAALPSSPRVDETLMSDIHGDSAPFDHLVRSASGLMRRFVCGALGEGWDPAQTDAVCTLLYYPGLLGKEGWPAEGECGLSCEGVIGLSERVRAHCTGTFHLVGDIWDRGPRGDDVLGTLMGMPNTDVQWGNHDVCWMGAAAGDPVCIATLLFNNLKRMSIEQFEQGYGISLQPLFGLGASYYADDGFMPPVRKAISSILFKCEGQAVARHPEWHMDDRLIWGHMDLAAGEAPVYGVRYPLANVDFPTYDPENPFGLNLDEARVLGGLIEAFTRSERLQAHVQWIYDHGSVYKVDGDLLLFHGCVPLENDGSFAAVDCGDGVARSGRALLDWTDALCRRAWTGRAQEDLDWMGYLWCGWQSTFAGRVVKTFERTYLTDKSTWVEPEDPYYALTKDDPAACLRIFEEFGIDPERGRIVNGHTPVKLPKGESPVRAGGKRLVIDGGLCQAYRKTTGIAGYTLVRRADELELITHDDFPGEEAVFTSCADTVHTSVVL